jgi:hypothetical protein
MTAEQAHHPTSFRLRLLILAGARDDWYSCDGQTRTRVLERLTTVMRAWRDHPEAAFITSFDDDVGMAGNPSMFGMPSIYIVLAVADYAVTAELVQQFREGEPRLDRFFSVRTLYGREFWPIEPGQAQEDR